MTIDLSKYELSKKYIQDYYLTKGQGDINRSISMMASVTFVPCIVVAYYIGEVSDWHPDVVKAIQRFKDFYGYTSVENKPEGAPI